jgi:hypothetical protein
VDGGGGVKISMLRGVRGGRGKESNNFVSFLFSSSSSLIRFIFITVSITSKWKSPHSFDQGCLHTKMFRDCFV